VYFTVAIPVTIIAFLVARPPWKDIIIFWRWFKERRSKRARLPAQSTLKRVLTEVTMAAEKDVLATATS
jgi:hypothetical protein